jgi:hypothetical protein
MSMRAVVICALAALVLGLMPASGAGGADGGPTAVASKKRCKGSLWKCAPKRYHLSVTDSVRSGPASGANLVENWTAEVDLVRIRRNFARVIYGTEGGKVNVSGSWTTVCPDLSTATVRVEPQTVPVPRGPGYPFLGDFGVEFTLVKTSGFKKNTYGGPLGTQGSGHSSLFVTAIDPCPGGRGTFQTELICPLPGMEGRGKVGQTVSGSEVFDYDGFEIHEYRWKLKPKK